MSHSLLPTNGSSRALVTGGTGFIGSHLVRHLQRQGWDVHLLVRANKPLMPGFTLHTYDGSTADVTAALEHSKPDVVFHLASLFIAQHSPAQIAPLIQANIILGTQLLEAMQACKVQALVNTGTSWQHFSQEAYRPVNLYAATKQAFEDILAYYCDTGAIHSITLKLFDSYGPKDKRNKLLALLLNSLQTREELQLSGGQQIFDLVHVNDICRAYVQAASLLKNPEQPACASYALSGGERGSLREVVALLEKVAGRSLPVQWGARPYRPREVMHLWDGPALPDWKPRITLAEGFQSLLREQCS